MADERFEYTQEPGMAEANSPSVRATGPSWRIFTHWLAPLLLFCAVMLVIAVAQRRKERASCL